jgi:hypothetical protein
VKFEGADGRGLRASDLCACEMIVRNNDTKSMALSRKLETPKNKIIWTAILYKKSIEE